MATRGSEGWHSAHAENFGTERWEVLHQALQRDVEHVCFVNPFLTVEARAALVHDYQLHPTSVPGCFRFEIPENSNSHFKAVENIEESTIFVEVDQEANASTHTRMPLSPFFFVDGGAVIAALSLCPEEGDNILDACAAPGGKALVLATAMFAKHLRADPEAELHGRVVCNEVSKPKAMRMQKAMSEFLPALFFDDARTKGPHVIFTSADASTPSNSMERHGPYDKILFDAPCTCDRHLLRDNAAKLESWSTGVHKVSSEKQLKWLNNALWMLKEGGMLLYCCTALSAVECDGVIERLLLKTKGSFELQVLPIEESILRMVPSLAAESTDWGTRILPDRTGFGPVYFSRLRMVKRTHEAVAHLPG